MAKSKSWNFDDLEKKGFVLDSNGNFAKITISDPYKSHLDPARIILKKDKRPKGRIINPKNPSLQANTDSGFTINIKPLSVNQAWQGRRFKSPKYKYYEENLLKVLPPMDIPNPPYEIYFRFGFSSKSSDWDNACKSTQDIIAKKYKFNDKLIKRAIIDVDYVPKGEEYLEFKIKTLTNV